MDWWSAWIYLLVKRPVAGCRARRDVELSLRGNNGTNGMLIKRGWLVTVVLELVVLSGYPDEKAMHPTAVMLSSSLPCKSSDTQVSVHSGHD